MVLDQNDGHRDLSVTEAERAGYLKPKILLNGKCAAVLPQIFTFGLFVGLTVGGCCGRYCYHSGAEAIRALQEWVGIGDPPGNWIKYKGKDGERSNPSYIKPPEDE